MLVNDWRLMIHNGNIFGGCVMKGLYILDEENKPVEIDDIEKWGEFYGSGRRRVGEDFVRNSRISTVFLGLDHSFSEEGPPILYETMIFGGKFDCEQWRYETREEAIAGHRAAVRKVVMEDRD